MPGSSIGDFVNGRFRAVKVALEPRSLERSLRELGWVIEVKPLTTPELKVRVSTSSRSTRRSR
jgi:hypothetical protein